APAMRPHWTLLLSPAARPIPVPAATETSPVTRGAQRGSRRWASTGRGTWGAGALVLLVLMLFPFPPLLRPRGEGGCWVPGAARWLRVRRSAAGGMAVGPGNSCVGPRVLLVPGDDQTGRSVHQQGDHEQD